MKTKTSLVLLALVLLPASTIFGGEIQDYVGNYELKGVMEMAGGLSLKADQKYVAGFSYGAADWMEEGRWKPEGDGVVLSGSHFKTKNAPNLPLFLPSGTHFTYQTGRLTATGPGGKVIFIDPNKTPSSGKKPGEGRMRVKGRVLKLDSETMMVKVKECMTFDVNRLSPEVLKKAQVGKSIDVEIPYSAIIGGETCPR